MLGYTLKDVVDMQISIREAIYHIPPTDQDTIEDLYKAIDFIQGLIVEGHLTDE